MTAYIRSWEGCLSPNKSPKPGLELKAKKPEKESAAPFVPDSLKLPILRESSKTCRGCHLYQNATQTVFGQGTDEAEVMFVGEQPGDQEDKAGEPFVGPAGRLLDKALADAGIDRSKVYVTNTVKHFKWKPVGKRRLHEKPNASEINACRPWLEAEIAAVRPKILVALGATAAQALLGKHFRVLAERGKWMDSPLAPQVTATVHPSSLLRAPDEETRRREYERFVADLKTIAKAMKKL